MITYEQRLNSNLDWALREGSLHFEKNNAVHKTLRKIIRHLEELGIPYAVMGDMAMFFHGYRRFTEVVDLLVTLTGLAEIQRPLDGLGYIFPLAGSKHLRDAEYGVKVEFLVTGDYPGKGKEIAFPNPQDATIEIDGVRCLQLPRLVELKLASGMTNPGRLIDLGDAQQLVETLNLPETFADQLHSYVRSKFKEIWAIIQNNPP